MGSRRGDRFYEGRRRGRGGWIVFFGGIVGDVVFSYFLRKGERF